MLSKRIGEEAMQNCENARKLTASTVSQARGRVLTFTARTWLSQYQDTVKLLVCMGSGIAFGFAVEKAKGRPEKKHNAMFSSLTGLIKAKI